MADGEGAHRRRIKVIKRNTSGLSAIPLPPIIMRLNLTKQKARSGFPERASQNLAPLTGLEPVTYGLTVRRSTD